MGKRRKKSPRRVSVLAIQRLPPEKIVDLFEQVNRGEVILLSIYPDRWAQIGLKSPALDKFAEKSAGLAKPQISKIIAQLSKRGFYEDQTAVSGQKKQENSKTLQGFTKRRLYCEKVL